MEHLQNFLETSCIRDRTKRITLPFLCEKFKEYLDKKFKISSPSFTSNLFTIRVKNLIEKINIPGDNSNSVSYNRDNKGTVIIGLTLNSNFDDDIKSFNEERRSKKNAYNAMHYSKNSIDFKENRSKRYNLTSFKTEFLKRMNLDPLDINTNKKYNQTARLGLIQKVFNPDNTINWDETIKLTLESENNYLNNKKNNPKLPSKNNLLKSSNSNNSVEIKTEVSVNEDAVNVENLNIKYSDEKLNPKLKYIFQIYSD